MLTDWFKLEAKLIYWLRKQNCEVEMIDNTDMHLMFYLRQGARPDVRKVILNITQLAKDLSLDTFKG